MPFGGCAATGALLPAKLRYLMFQVANGYMAHWPKESKLALITSSITLSGVASGSLFYIFFGNALIASAYSGESIDFLNRLIAQHRMSRPYGTLEHYFTLGRLLFSRILFVCIALQVMVVAGLMYRHTLRIIKGFFAATTHPFNLAVFRVVLFYTILGSVNISSLVWFSQIPAELRVPPIGLGWLLEFLPINPTWAKVSARLLLACSFTAMIGFCSRTSALLTVILGFYVLGIPQFYGKVNHYHHLLWFAAILAASRCGDVFSVDALIGAWRRADRGSVDPPGASQTYALPLRFIWLLMGMIYFFGGSWKLWSGGVDWALSENLKFIMYQKWTELDGWTPFFRIDQYPVLYKSAALGTIAFEISFVFLLFSRRLRLLAALGGIVFHNMTDVFMRISFASLLRCYVAFFDWHAILSRIGRWLYGGEMYVLYDANCQLCRRTIALLRVFDVFGRVTYVNACDDEAVREHGLQWLGAPALLADMHVVVRQNVWRGWASYRALAFRIPVLWPAVPFLYMWPVPVIANRVYRHVADSRTCSIAHLLLPRAEATRYKPQVSSRAVTAVGVFLLSANILAGIGDVGASWPIARYPTFAGISGPEIKLLEMIVQRAGGETIRLNGQPLNQNVDTTRFLGLMGQVISAETEAQRRVRSKALWRLWVRNDPTLEHAHSVRFYKVTISAIPERWKKNPLHRELLFELTL